MKRNITIALIAIMLGLSAVTLIGCTQADRVNNNLTVEADSFNIYRRVVVFNNFTDTILFEALGYMSIDFRGGDRGERLWITMEVTNSEGESTGQFVRHMVAINETTTWIVEDLSDGTETHKYKYIVNFVPEMVQPFTIETIR